MYDAIPIVWHQCRHFYNHKLKNALLNSIALIRLQNQVPATTVKQAMVSHCWKPAVLYHTLFKTTSRHRNMCQYRTPLSTLHSLIIRVEHKYLRHHRFFPNNVSNFINDFKSDAPLFAILFVHHYCSGKHRFQQLFLVTHRRITLVKKLVGRHAGSILSKSRLIFNKSNPQIHSIFF